MNLQRPIFKWLLFALCVLLFVAALGWVTLRMSAMEKHQQAAVADATLQEKVRLALWRMDSMVTTLLVRENSRPANHYQAFYSPTDLFSNRSQAELPKDAVLSPSPLLGSIPEFVQLHFELQRLPGVQTCSSPQVPTGNELALASNWYAVSPQIERSKDKLKGLEGLLKQHPLDGSPRQKAAVPAAAMSEAAKPKSLPGSIDQGALNSSEMRQRLSNASTSKDLISVNNLTFQKKASPAPTALADSATATRLTPQSAAAPAEAPANPPTAAPTDLRPRWLGNELILLRQASGTDVGRLQGIWLDWDKLHEHLLSTIRDLLPAAQLVATESVGQDATALVTLPVRVLPGAISLPIMETSPLSKALLVAWLCFGIATIAVAVLLHRAMQLSERRGAFVSAVTHELRTPLTTFQLYSEMLADDMVPDPATRKDYLQTLCDESTRLSHLVENVLSYSRIERGRASARKEQISVTDLLQRILPRLEQRTRQVQLTLNLHFDPSCAAAFLEIDTVALEQILFNLVDNACKYAAPQSSQPCLELCAAATDRALILQVQDHGPGISAKQRNRLFQAFEKSATEAAHSAPGVGLGLALCRRLANEIGAKLVLASNEAGATFQLTLPVAAGSAA